MLKGIACLVERMHTGEGEESAGRGGKKMRGQGRARGPLATFLSVLLVAAVFPTAASGLERVSPILECVTDNGGGTYTAFFSSLNRNATPVTIPIGGDNKFTPSPQDRGQPTTFQPGRTPYWPNAAFSVVFGGSNLVWTLRAPGTSGGTSTASAFVAQRQWMDLTPRSTAR